MVSTWQTHNNEMLLRMWLYVRIEYILEEIL